MTERTNIKEIYTYTEKHIEGINKSIDALGSKLISTLGFSGVLLKFVSDMASNKDHTYPFWFIVLASVSLLLAIGFCASGLYPRNSGCAVDPKVLLKYSEWNNCTEEDYRKTIIEQWYEHIDSLESLLVLRQGYLKLAIGLLTFVAVLFCLINIVTPILIFLNSATPSATQTYF